MKPAAIVVAGLGLPVMLIVALIGLVSYEEAEAVCLPGGPALSVDPSRLPAGGVAGFTGEQLVNAAHIMAAGATLGLTVRDQQIGVMTAIGESGLRVLDYGDVAGPDSRGLFQQRDNGAWGSYQDRMDPYRSALSFFQVLATIPGRASMEPTLVANAVQRNADPWHYQRFWDPAGLIVQALAGLPTSSTATAGASVYELGPVRPQTALVANTVGPMFGITLAYGWREVDPYPDHPSGLAIDFMTSNLPDGTTAGDELAAYLQQHSAELGVDYLIWRQRIWSPARATEGWRLMEDRGSPTQNHMDHVHLTLTGLGSSTLTGVCGSATSTGVVGGQGWAAPAAGPISSGFGPRWGGMHYGTDFAPPCDAPIWAAAGGTVTFAGPAAGYGNWITIAHGADVVTTYGHMFADGVLVRTGDVVQPGQQIARIGTAGDSTGCHLHFEVLTAGRYVDPLAFLTARTVQIPGIQS